MTLPGLRLDSNLVEAEEIFSQSGFMSAQRGDTAKIQSWCYDENDSEIGYVEVEGELKAVKGRAGSVVFNPPLEELDFARCVKSETSRGIFPCIESSPSFIVLQ